MKQTMNRGLTILTLGLCGLMAMASATQAQKTKKATNVYIGYVYPAGGQQGTTFQVRIGGQRVESACGATVSGEGVRVKLVECNGKVGNQDMKLLKG